jgi:hypothetical protein
VTSGPDKAFTRHLEEARQIVRTIEAGPTDLSEYDSAISEAFEQIRWFPLPDEALARLRRTDAA